MRTLKGQNLIHDNDYARFPNGAILNETDTREGTPVVREVYNDALMNIYKIVEEAGLKLNEKEDNEQNGYQLLEAIKRLFNTLKDTEKLLQGNGNNYSVNIDLDLFPNKSFIIAKTDSKISASATKTFKGSGPETYSFVGNEANEGDELIIVLDKSGIRYFNITFLKEAYPLKVSAYPIQFSTDVNTPWYYEDGVLFNDLMRFANILNSIRYIDVKYINYQIDSIAKIDDTFIIFAYDELGYAFFLVKENNLINPILMSIEGFTFGTNVASNVRAYFDRNSVYLTNRAGNTIINNNLSLCNINIGSNKIVFRQNVALNLAFKGGNNAIVNNGSILALEDGNLVDYSLTESRNVIAKISTYSNLFRINDYKLFATENQTVVKINI